MSYPGLTHDTQEGAFNNALLRRNRVLPRGVAPTTKDGVRSMQTTALARTLAKHRAPQRPKAPTIGATPATPTKPNPLIAAITRHIRAEPRTIMEMARDRESVRHPWQ